MIDYTGKPFFLSKEDINWVEDTYKKMTFEEKIGQLFCPIIFTNDSEELKAIVQKKHIGGALYREGKALETQRNHRILQESATIPLLIAANLESGGNGIAEEGTYYGKEMLVAAAGDEKYAYQLGKVSGKEGACVGVNWAFAPVVDIDYNFHNPITNVRTFGSDSERVKKLGLAYVKGCMEEGLATAIKHFPGDGVDERDQHLLVSVNTMTCDEWDKSYGDVYQALIDEGSLTVMAGHIALPAYEEKFSGNPVKEIVPATLSLNLMQKLLRKKLGFNGLIITDATPMVGFCAAMDRKTAVPLSIEVGCDMFLFNKNLDEDIHYMTEGYHKGILSEQRLEEAILRILATKAALKLHIKQKNHQLVPDKEALDVLNNKEHDLWAKECAIKGVTLVKNNQNILPINPNERRKVLLQLMGDFSSNDRVFDRFYQGLTQEGFEVTKYIPEDFSKPLDDVETFKSKYDLVIYIGNIETASNKVVSRLNWFTFFGQGNNIPWFVKEVPTIFISVGNPYHLLDVPMVPCYINGYCNSNYVMDAIIEKLVGKSSFLGVSPVDAFCGRIDAKLG